MPCVDINNRKMARQATEHMIGLGRRNILMLIPETVHHLTCMQDRKQGYYDALINNGIPISDDFINIMPCSQDRVTTFLKDLNSLKKIDAIFCATDHLAALCIEPLGALGIRIPEDIALMGFDNDFAFRQVTPALSSVRLPLEKQIYTAIDLLLKILNKEVPYEPGFFEIETELVIRESTAGTEKPNSSSDQP